ncbi:hypothetical protein PENSPDRAFT_657284 [Peniophora sp. CONT]|nr:hypothetical protein PENSPDRAFT_657284 [Peniophora sp. CONT]
MHHWQAQSSALSELPIDIVCQIYQILAHVSKPQRYRPGRWPASRGLPGSLGWIYLTHVCHRFRIIGLEMQTLWANDLCALPAAFDIFMERSHHAPLHCELDSSSFNPTLLLEKLPRVMSQVRSLTVRWECDFPDATEAARFLHGLTQIILPRMETMILNISPPHGFVFLDDLRALAAKGSDPFHAPALRLLRVHHLFVPFCAPSLQSLTVQSCKNFDIHDLCRALKNVPSLQSLTIQSCGNFDVHDLCRALKNVPKLRYLRWCGSGRRRNHIQDDHEHDSIPLPNLGTVHLPQLKSFDLSHDVSVLRQLAKTINFPPICLTGPRPFNPPSICLGYINSASHVATENIVNTCARFTSRLPSSASHPLALTIPISSTYSYNVLLGEVWDPASHHLRNVACTIFGLSCAYDRAWASPIAALIKGVTASSSLASDICSLYVIGDIPYDSMEERYPHEEVGCTLNDALLALYKVTNLYLASQAEGLIEALRHSEQLDDGSDIIFPLLDTIILDHTDRHVGWSRGTSMEEYEKERHYKTPEDRHFDGSWWDDFCEMLAERDALGYRLRRLILRGRTCHVATGDIKGDKPVICLEPLLELQDLSEWVDEVVDERDACGMKDGPDNLYYVD